MRSLLQAGLLVMWVAGNTSIGQTYVTPMMGGGQVAADMAHIDLFYDNESKQLLASADTSSGLPELRVLEEGYAFDAQRPFAVLNGKAYNAQYGWNVGGLFTLPAGTAIWVEVVDCSPGLEVYSGWGRNGTYVPILGTAGSSRIWKWSGVMTHNTYAVSNWPTDRVFADYHIYLGDATTGSRSNFMSLGDTFIRLEWTTAPVENPLTFKFGAAGETNGAELTFLSRDESNQEAVIFLQRTNTDYARDIPMLVVPATTQNGGPAPGHAALNSRLELEIVSLDGPGQATLTCNRSNQKLFKIVTGTTKGTNRFALWQNQSCSEDPFNFLPGVSFEADREGLYSLGFRVVDVCTNGPGGSPLHAPSPAYHVYLQAGLTIGGLTKDNTEATARFAGEPGKNYVLERCSTLSDPWEEVAGPVEGTSHIQTLTDSNPPSAAFYRVKVR